MAKEFPEELAGWFLQEVTHMPRADRPIWQKRMLHEKLGAASMSEKRGYPMALIYESGKRLNVDKTFVNGMKTVFEALKKE